MDTITSGNMISIRPAVENDKEAICSVDLIAQCENERREFIRRFVTPRETRFIKGICPKVRKSIIDLV